MTREGAYDSLREVSNMRSAEQISLSVDGWIVEEELPAPARLKLVRTTDPDYGLTEDEIADRNEFIRCQLSEDFEPLTWVPRQDPQDDFFIADLTVEDEEWSAFNTHDFQRMQRPFNKYGYAMKQIMERVKDLAIMHSSISFEKDREDVHQRYESFVNYQFRNRLLALSTRYRRTRKPETRIWLKRRVAELNRRILECKNIWERYAPPENWDR
jgi:hypothetical protein